MSLLVKTLLFNQQYRSIDPGKLAPVVMMMKDFEGSLRDRKRFAVDVQEDGIVLSGQEKYYLLLSKVI
jgi:hypothetical protein